MVDEPLILGIGGSLPSVEWGCLGCLAPDGCDLIPFAWSGVERPPTSSETRPSIVETGGSLL